MPDWENGQDVLDWFAGQALIGILMNGNTPRAGESPIEVHAAAVAEQAYAYAEAMLTERRKRLPKGGQP